jgi:hypothetical protein
MRIFNSTFADTTAGNYNAFRFSDNSFVSFQNSTIHDSAFNAGGTFQYYDRSSGSFTDCRLLNNHALLQTGVLGMFDSSTVNILRTIVADNSAGTYAGCFQIDSAATIMIDDSDIVNCRTDVTQGFGGGVAYVGLGSLTITNSRIRGSSTAQKGSVAYVGGGVLSIAGSTITDSADGSFAIYDATGADFSIQVLRDMRS